MATDKRDIKREQARAQRLQYFRTEAVELLQRFTEALNAEGIDYWLEFGTLLGYYREHDFIAHDDDLDFGAYLTDAAKVRRTLEARGFKLIRRYTDNGGGLEECYRYLHTTLDVFYFSRDSEGLHCTSYTRAKKSLLSSLLNRRPCMVKRVSIPDNGLAMVTYKGCTIGVPIDCKEHLTWHYGPTFMTPNPNFNYKEEAKNIRYYSLKERKGRLMIFGKKG